MTGNLKLISAALESLSKAFLHMNHRHKDIKYIKKPYEIIKRNYLFFLNSYINRDAEAVRKKITSYSMDPNDWDKYFKNARTSHSAESLVSLVIIDHILAHLAFEVKE